MTMTATHPLPRHLEALVRWKQQDPRLARLAHDRPVQSLGIVGAGLMGTAIAAVAVQQGLSVAITDSNPTALTRVRPTLEGELGDAGPQRHGSLPVEVTSDLARVARCDVVLESIVENPAAKRDLYASLEPGLSASSALTTNTSAIPIRRLAEGLADPSRFCGLHFFHPVRHRPVVEVIRGPQTSEKTVGTAVSLVRALGRLPLVVADGPGFLVNRLLVAYMTEVFDLLMDGARIEDVEGAAIDFGMAMGPLRLLDEIGLETGLLAGRVLWEAFPERVVASPLLVAMYKAGRVGRKVGRGFFDYPAGRDKDAPGLPAPQVQEILAKWRRAPQPLTPEMLTHRLFLPMLLEATRVLEDGGVADPRDVDLGVVFGLGFPASRGGLLHWADTLGAARVVELLGPLRSLGPRAQPTALLIETARSGGRFYPDIDA